MTLRANAADGRALESQLALVFAQRGEASVMLVDDRALYNVCKFSNLKRTQFAEEVGEILSGTKWCNAHGVWLYTEYESGVWVFVKMSEPKGPDVYEQLGDGTGRVINVELPTGRSRLGYRGLAQGAGAVGTEHAKHFADRPATESPAKTGNGPVAE